MRKKKVLFVDFSISQGGSTHSLLSTLNALDYNRFDVTLYIMNSIDKDLSVEIPDQVRVIQDTVVEHYYRNVRSAAYNVLLCFFKYIGLKKKSASVNERFNQYIHNLKITHPYRCYFSNTVFEVVISNMQGACEEIAANIKAKKHISMYHSSRDTYHEMHEKLYPQFDTIVTVSPGAQKVMCESYPSQADKIIVIPNYINAEQVLKKCKNGDLVIRDNKHEVTICTCGRITKEKGFDLAVKAAAILQKDKIDFHWFFVGDGQERCDIEHLIFEYGLTDNITITGFQNNPYRYIAACNVYVQPSYEESYGRTIKEAQILSCPIVSTDTAGARYILEDGDRGILTSVSPQGLAEGIKAVIELKHEIDSEYTLLENEKEKISFAKAWNNLLESED